MNQICQLQRIFRKALNLQIRQFLAGQAPRFSQQLPPSLPRPLMLRAFKPARLRCAAQARLKQSESFGGLDGAKTISSSSLCFLHTVPENIIK